MPMRSAAESQPFCNPEGACRHHCAFAGTLKDQLKSFPILASNASPIKNPRLDLEEYLGRIRHDVLPECKRPPVLMEAIFFFEAQINQYFPVAEQPDGPDEYGDEDSAPPIPESDSKLEEE